MKEGGLRTADPGQALIQGSLMVVQACERLCTTACARRELLHDFALKFSSCETSGFFSAISSLRQCQWVGAYFVLVQDKQPQCVDPMRRGFLFGSIQLTCWQRSWSKADGCTSTEIVGTLYGACPA
jgi:hypothetical protein